MELSANEQKDLGSISLSPKTHAIWGTIFSEAGGIIENARIECNGYEVYSDPEGKYELLNLLKGHYSITVTKTMYSAVTKEIDLTAPLELDFNLEPTTPVHPTVRWARVRPSVITLGERVYVDCQLVCFTPGTYEVDCVIDGVSIPQTYVFSEDQPHCTQTYEYIPNEVGGYSATILDFSQTFEVREPLEAKLSCPYCGVRNICINSASETEGGPSSWNLSGYSEAQCYGAWWCQAPDGSWYGPFSHKWQCEKYEGTIIYYGSWEEINSESRLVEHIMRYRHVPLLFYSTPGTIRGWVSINCPYCGRRFDYQYVVAGITRDTKPLVYELIDHIKTAHPSEWGALLW